MKTEFARKLCARAVVLTLSMCGLAAGMGLITIACGPKSTVQGAEEYGDIEHTSDPSRIKYNKSLFSYVGETPIIEEDTLLDLSLTGDLHASYSDLSKACNLEIYELCASYFNVNVNNIRVPIFYPMALSNNESSIRADKDMTFCSLYPSGVVTPTSADDISSFNVKDVVADATTFSKLANDWWTRDRGPIQMNGSYGVRNDSFNAQLGPSEKELLKHCEIAEDFTAYTSKEGIISGTYFVENSSENKGDRYNIRDICLRLSSECTYSLSVIQKTYELTNSRLAMVMLSMHHGAGSLWLPNYENSSIGYWNSGRLAYEYATAVASDEVYTQIYAKAEQDLKYARTHSSNPDIGISTSVAMDMYKDFESQGLLNSIDYYTHSGDFRKDYIVYPIKLLYNYAQLNLLYNGG